MDKKQKIMVISKYIMYFKKIGCLFPLEDLGYKKEYTIVTRNYSNIVFGVYKDENGIMLYLRRTNDNVVVKKNLLKILTILKKLVKNEKISGKKNE